MKRSIKNAPARTSTPSSQDGDSGLSGSDAPRIALWEPDDGFEHHFSDSGSEKLGESSIRKLDKPERRIERSSVSFGSWKRAHEKLREESSEDGVDSMDEDTEINREDGRSGADTSIVNQALKAKNPEKRANKNAPVEMTAKRPVTRRRQVVEVKKTNHQDPRFVSLSGEFSPGAFHKRYAFLTDMHKSELSTLKENLKRARTMLRSSPKDQRKEREEEVQRLERALKRAESQVNKDTRENIERTALDKVRDAEKQQRKQGKGAWYMKNSAKKDILLRARHDALAEQGGRLAVRKAIDKRQKKIGQKEKKRRPSFYPRSTGEADDRSNANKRRRV